MAPNTPRKSDIDFEPTWFAPPLEAPAATTEPQAPSPSTVRLWTYWLYARGLIAGGLLALQLLLVFLEVPLRGPLWLCGGYVALTIAALRWTQPPPTVSLWSSGWVMTLWTDLALFTALQLWPQHQVDYTPLFALPVLLGASMGPLLLALGSAAAATLALLLDAWYSTTYSTMESTSHFVHSALTGAGLFLVALLGHQLASRLQREQAHAQQNQKLARTEAEVNNLIVTGLKEGVLVVNAEGHVWHANLAACHILGLPANQSSPSFVGHTPGWPQLVQHVRRHLQAGQDSHTEMTLPTGPRTSRRLSVRTRITQASHATDAVCVVFLEDLRDVEARVRNEKLVAMGRVSAALAHEIRNPLAAIVQANALLAEDATHPGQQRLTQMVEHNAQRLKRTVNDILEVVRPRPEQHAGNLIELDPTLQHIVQEWMQVQASTTPLALHWNAPDAVVHFDPEHLRRVVGNLLDNAIRHTQGSTEPIQLHTETPPAHTGEHPMVQLRIWNPGPPLDTQIHQHLFEPFTSSNSRSSGLGLYLCRELCDRYQARLHYESGPHDAPLGHTFVVCMPLHPHTPPAP